MRQWESAKIYEWERCSEIEITKLFEDQTIVLLDVDPCNVVNQSTLLLHLIAQHKSGKRLVAFGTGISLLAQAGLLNGKTVCLNREHLSDYSIRYPQVNFDVNIPFSCDQNLYCSASSVEVIKPDCPIVEDASFENYFFPNSITSKISNLCISNLNSGNYSNCNTRLEETLLWATSNLDQIKNLDQLADRSFMSRRNFDRQFRIIYNQSPKSWLTEKRIELAINYLKSSAMCIEDIAYAAGFSSAVNFRNNFKNYVGVSPSEYRNNTLSTA